MSAITIFIPSAANRSASASPIPLAAPVTTAIRSLKVFTRASLRRRSKRASRRESRHRAEARSRGPSQVPASELVGSARSRQNFTIFHGVRLTHLSCTRISCHGTHSAVVGTLLSTRDPRRESGGASHSDSEAPDRTWSFGIGRSYEASSVNIPVNTLVNGTITVPGGPTVPEPSTLLLSTLGGALLLAGFMREGHSFR